MIGSFDDDCVFVCFGDLKQSFRNWSELVAMVVFVVPFDEAEYFFVCPDNFVLLIEAFIEVLSVTGLGPVQAFLGLQDGVVEPVLPLAFEVSLLFCRRWL